MQAFSTNSDQALDAVLGRGSPTDGSFYMKDHYRGVLWQMLPEPWAFPRLGRLKNGLLNGQTWLVRSGSRVAEIGSLAVFKFMPWLVIRTLLQPLKNCRTDGQNISSFWHGGCARTRFLLKVEQASLVSTTSVALLSQRSSLLLADHPFLTKPIRAL